MEFLDAAFYLTQFGWKVFPLMPGQKIPAVPKAAGGRGCLDATDDENQIGAWSRRYPHANVGLACGQPSGIVVIDFDPRNGSDASLANLTARRQTFPATVTAKTANGGTHLYYAFDPSLKNSKSALAPGIDIKTTGGYVVAAPSVLDGGKRYTWVNSPLGPNLPRLPTWIVEALKPKPKPVLVHNRDKPAGDATALVRFVAEAQQGDRNNKLFWAAAKAAAEGSLAAERSALEAAGLSIGLDAVEVRRTIDSAEKKCSKLA